jgi:uncharacterized flavoprotein (TIGR03862 family)
VGAGPAGLMAAEGLSAAGVAVTVHERMASPARKFLMAGRGGLNLTHAEPLPQFIARYGAAEGWLGPMIEAFPPNALRVWADGLGEPTFVGPSGRVFPKSLKASPLLRAWLKRLAAQGVVLRTRSEWRGFDGEALLFADADGAITRETPDAAILALGGASWPRLGGDGTWTRHFDPADIGPFRPANCGFDIAWSEAFRTRFAGTPLKTIALTHEGKTVRGEAVITAYGIEGGAVYALSAGLRDAIARDGQSTLHLDLKPDLSLAALAARLGKGPAGQSLSTRLKKAGLPPIAAALLREALPAPPRDADSLAATLKALPLPLLCPRGLDRAISSAGGVRLQAFDPGLMLKSRPGLFLAGEMLDWEAPTGGYLLQASFSMGVWVAKAVLARLEKDHAQL